MPSRGSHLENKDGRGFSVNFFFCLQSDLSEIWQTYVKKHFKTFSLLRFSQCFIVSEYIKISEEIFDTVLQKQLTTTFAVYFYTLLIDKRILLCTFLVSYSFFE